MPVTKPVNTTFIKAQEKFKELEICRFLVKSVDVSRTQGVSLDLKFLLRDGEGFMVFPGSNYNFYITIII